MNLIREECEKALNGLRILEREENFKKWNQVAPQIKCDVIESLIHEHFDNPPLKFEELIKHEVVWDNEVKEYAFVLEQYKPTLLNVYAPNDLLAISLKYRWVEEIECLLSQKVGESINDHFVPNRFYRKRVKNVD